MFVLVDTGSDVPVFDGTADGTVARLLVREFERQLCFQVISWQGKRHRQYIQTQTGTRSRAAKQENGLIKLGTSSCSVLLIVKIVNLYHDD